MGSDLGHCVSWVASHLSPKFEGCNVRRGVLGGRRKDIGDEFEASTISRNPFFQLSMRLRAL